MWKKETIYIVQIDYLTDLQHIFHYFMKKVRVKWRVTGLKLQS